MTKKICMNCQYCEKEYLSLENRTAYFCAEPCAVKKDNRLKEVKCDGVCDKFVNTQGLFSNVANDFCHQCVCSKGNGDDGYVTHNIVPNSMVATMDGDRTCIELSVDYKCENCGNVITVYERFETNGNFVVEGSTDIEDGVDGHV